MDRAWPKLSNILDEDPGEPHIGLVSLILILQITILTRASQEFFSSGPKTIAARGSALQFLCNFKKPFFKIQNGCMINTVMDDCMGPCLVKSPKTLTRLKRWRTILPSLGSYFI